MKPYSSKEESCYDLNDYFGRLNHFQKIINPSNMFYTDQQILDIYKELQLYDEGKLEKKYSDEQLWNMRFITLSNLHQETKQPINRCFSLAGFVPTNIPICIALSILPPTIMMQFFSQIINQSYNFAFNYANRNASNTFTDRQLLGAYLGAVATSIVGSVGIIKGLEKTSWKPSIKSKILIFAPFFGIVSANLFNLFFSRVKDFQDGITVKDSKTNIPDEQKSKYAAKQAFLQTAFSRVIIPMNIVFFPKLMINIAEKLNIKPKGKIGNSIFNTAISGFSLWYALSASIAYFPQTCKVHHTKLEPQFQNKLNKNGDLIEYYEFNKGL